MEPRQNMLKVNFRPNLSENAAQPIRPPRFPAASTCTAHGTRRTILAIQWEQKMTTEKDTSGIGDCLVLEG